MISWPAEITKLVQVLKSLFFSDPDKPVIATTVSTLNTIVINGSGITTSPATNFDKFSVTAITPDSSPAFNRTVTGSFATTGDLEITGLASGTQYTIDVVTEVGSGPTPCANPSSIDSAVEQITVCTRKLISFVLILEPANLRW